MPKDPSRLVSRSPSNSAGERRNTWSCRWPAAARSARFKRPSRNRNEQGRMLRDDEIVRCITGNVLKTQDAVAGYLEKPAVIKPSLDEFEPLVTGVPEPALV